MWPIVLLLACRGPVGDAIDAATPDPELRAELHRVARRESNCNPDQGPHDGDAWAGRRMWEGAVARGWLDPERCPEHALSPSWRWAPRGVLGVSPAWTLRFAEPCTGPQAHDDPTEAVALAVAWVDHLAERGAVSCPQRVRVWMGAGVWLARSPLDRVSRTVRQCGPASPAAWIGAAMGSVGWWVRKLGRRAFSLLTG